MSESVTITMGLPPKALHPNARPHHHEKARATKAYRRAAYLRTVAAGVESGPWERATVSATFYHRVSRRRDDVNFLAAMKPAYDGLVDAGLLEDDDSEHLTTLPASFQIDTETPRVELRIERTE